MPYFSFWILLVIWHYFHLYLNRFRKEAMLDIFSFALLSLLLLFHNSHSTPDNKCVPCHGIAYDRHWRASAAGASSPPDQSSSFEARSTIGRSEDIFPLRGTHTLLLYCEYLLRDSPDLSIMRHLRSHCGYSRHPQFTKLQEASLMAQGCGHLWQDFHS